MRRPGAILLISCYALGHQPLGIAAQGCGMADVTLKQGIERMIREEVPQVIEIVDVTDHAAGQNPYFTASKK